MLRLRIRFPPCVSQQIGRAHHPPRLASQNGQQIKLAGSEFNGRTLHQHDMTLQINL